MTKPQDLLLKLQNVIFSEEDKQEENQYDAHSDPFFNVTDLGRDSWIKTGWDLDTTNKPYPWQPGSVQGNVVEQDEKEEEPKEEPMPPEPQAEPEPEPPEDTGINTDMGNMDASMGGLGIPEEEPKEPKELGRIYELKKIYTRLTSIESYLSNSSDESLIKLRNYVSRAIELFKLIVDNMDSYKDRIDDIIVTYYKFLDLVYSLLKQYYNKKENQVDEA